MGLPKRYGKKSREPNTGEPIEMPAGFCRPTPLNELIARMVRQAVSDEQNEEFETLEESDDFEVDEDDLLDLSPYEMTVLEDELPISELEEESPEEPLPEPPDPASEPEPEPPQNTG